MDYTILDFEVLDDAITFAVEHPDEFNMDFWFRRLPSCGTTGCLAGTIAVRAGYKPLWYGTETYGGATHVRLPDGTRDAVWNVAARLLGPDPYGDGVLVDGLFYAGDLDEVIQIRNRWARKAGVPQRTWNVPPAVTHA